MRSEIIPDIKKDYLKNLLKNGRRCDERAMDEHRPISVQFGICGAAEGSARVQMGKSDVIVGIKMGLGEPYSDSPDSGVMTTNVEMSPIASPVFETGPPREEAIELARVTDRAIRESQVIDFKKLCITPGEKIWMVFIDIQPVDYDGNLFDAAEVASLAALMCTNVPAKDMGVGEENFPMPVCSYPISCTSVKIGDTILMDPNLDEEIIADSRITVSIDENGNVRAIQKGLSGGFTVDEIRKIIRTSAVMGANIRKQLLAALEKDA